MPTLVSVSVAPLNPFILIGTTQAFIATAHYDDLSTADVSTNPSTLWLSSVPSIATIPSNSPIATALTSSGSTIISATYGGQTGTAILRVGLANYTKIYEQIVDLSADRNPISRMTTPNFSMFSGGVTMQNFTGTSGGSPIGWTIAMSHPGDAVKSYIAREQQQVGQWVQQYSNGTATTIFNSSQTSLGVVSSIAVDMNDLQLTSGGNPVLVQYTGEAYVFFGSNVIARGNFLIPDAAGVVKATPFDPMNPTAIIGFALENSSSPTYPGMILMRIQICGE
jgi:hypothetical protein